METPETKVNETENLIDGKKLSITFRDGSTGTAHVRKIPICDMDDLGRSFGKNAAECAVYLGRDEAFARTLDDESFAAVFEEGRRLNFPSFRKWWAWQEQTLEALGQKDGRDDLVNKVVQKMTERQLAAEVGKSRSASASSS